MTPAEFLARYPEALIAIPVLAFIAGLLLMWQISLWWRVRRGHRGQGRGRRAEKRALRLLKKQGYILLEREPRFETRLLVEGELRSFTVTPDFLVTRDDRDYVVEVKRRAEGNSIQGAGVRRQVTEYLLATDLPCLLVCMPEGVIEEISFPEA